MGINFSTPTRGTLRASRVLSKACIENKGVGLAPQVGLEPTTLRLTAEWPFVTSRCKHDDLRTRFASSGGIWGDFGGTAVSSPEAGPDRAITSVHGLSTRSLPRSAYFGQGVSRATLSCHRCPPRWSPGVA